MSFGTDDTGLRNAANDVTRKQVKAIMAERHKRADRQMLGCLGIVLSLAAAGFLWWFW